jgi:molybdopterin biosynthesis enzyme
VFGGVVFGNSANNKIRDSNRPMLLAAAREAGAEAIDLGIVADKQVFS